MLPTALSMSFVFSIGFSPPSSEYDDREKTSDEHYPAIA